MSKRQDVPGNSIASELEYQRQMIRAAEQLLRLDRVLERLWDEGRRVLSMSVRMPREYGDDVLVVIRCDYDGAREVAFVSSDSVLDAVRKAAASLENGSVKWRDDEYANG